MRLNRQFLESRISELGEINTGPVDKLPEKVIQFGEGNFLRAFVDWQFNELNKKGLFNGRIVVVQPLKNGMIDTLNEQDGLYTLLLRGIQKGEEVEKKEIITSVSRGINPYNDWEEFLKCASNPDLRCMVSNTTEAGIEYVQTPFPENHCPDSFPAKVTAFLYRRFKEFSGAEDRGMIMIPCELIENNGDELKSCVLKHASDWELEEDFIRWLENDNHFFSTLVDRIVPGYPKDEIERITEEIGYEDRMLVSAEIFHLWVIKGDKRVNGELPFEKAGLNVVWTDDITPYRTLKVRILNGSHTMFTIPSFLAGNDTVMESVENEITGAFIKEGLFNEIMPTLDFPEEKKREFAEAVIERFKNPFIKHYLLSITLNSVSKFRVRVLPSLMKYYELNNNVPAVLSFSLAALVAFYKNAVGEKTNGNRKDYNLKDSPDVIEFFEDYKNGVSAEIMAEAVLKNQSFWGTDLTEVEGLKEKVAVEFSEILNLGAKDAMTKLINSN
jgi:tagaturonate reductase